MNISQRLRRLESNSPSEVSTGQPLQPMGVSDQQYQQLVIDKRQELELLPSDPLPLLSLVEATV
jgi:hypothetical protein